VSWKLRGSYVEPCSCDLICLCDASFDHGATYDLCRVTLVFDIREGEIDGFHPTGSQLTVAEATRSDINAFGIEFEGKSGLSTSEFSWAA
jgi:hypothetical protein